MQRKDNRLRPLPWAFPAILVACLFALHCGTRPEERRIAIYDLKADPTPENLQEIRELLEDEDRDVRATALHALVGLDQPDAANLALAALQDPDGFVRATAAKLLGDLGDTRNVSALAACLRRDPDPVARLRAAESLARLGDAAALSSLMQGLADPMERVRMAVIDGLSEIDPVFATAELTRVLHEDAVWEVRARAAHALGLSGIPEVVADLRTASLEDSNEFVRTAASNALRVHERVLENPAREREEP